MHNIGHMPARLIIALTLSLVLHAALLFTDAWRPSPPRPAPALIASLRLAEDKMPKPAEPPPAVEDLLKNTLEEEKVVAKDSPPAKAPPPKPARRPAEAQTISRREMAAVRKKLSEYVFYPEQARRLGLEGTVTLFVTLADDGRVEDVRVDSSSGYPVLDNAAVKGFYAVGRFPGKSGIWHYTFRLE